MLRSWISGKATNLVSHQSPLSFSKEAELHDLDDALTAVNLIFDDDIDGAEAGLADGQSSFHQLGRSLTLFLRASLGFEAEIMQRTTDALAAAETRSTHDLRHIQKDRGPNRSAIYEAGGEFALCIAMAQLMSAVMSVFRENIMDGAKAFWKLNSAYKVLQRIIDSENVYLNKRELEISRTAPSTPLRPEFRRQFSSVPSSPTRQFSRWEHEQTKEQHSKEKLEDEDEFYDAEEDVETPDTHAITDRAETSSDHQTEFLHLRSVESLDNTDLTSPLDIFIHSGANLCMGLLLLMLSLVPPAFSRLLGMVGYRGDRKKGLRMLWNSSRYSNAMGALAALILLAYYNGLMGATDIILPIDSTKPIWSDHNLYGYPAEELEALLKIMRTKFPKSKIWPLEQARMLALQCNLLSSLEILKGDFTTPLKQLQALAVFERSLQAMYTHDYELCTSSFRECCERNNWSHSLYLYCAGAAQVELYRLSKHTGEAERAKKYAAAATKLLLEARDKTGRRKAFGRQLPFDTFVAHKINKWEARASTMHIPFMDAIGVSPMEEMIFLWNGFRKMSPDTLEISLERIAWSESRDTWPDEDLGENSLLLLLRAVVLRSMGQCDNAMALLKDKLLCIDRSMLKGIGKEDWILPAAHYEAGINLWMMCHRNNSPEAKSLNMMYLSQSPTGTGELGQVNKKLMLEAAQLLEKAGKWDRYMLDSRLGMRIEAALDVVRRWRIKWDS